LTPPRCRYRTDLTDAQWRILEPLMPAPKPGGRPPVHQHRELLNAMLYRLRAGCAWRLLAHDLPPWQTVYHYFRKGGPHGYDGAKKVNGAEARGGPAQVGGGADLRMAGAIAPTQQGLRVPAGHR
jgi:transposase